ncbi:MAG: 16S rRNA (uracil(1498)-N(3))-methyltransferase [Bacteroidales bacterium]|nr:16S rRNA (uracil(1498)-N(3))-methyltransferase [Bacteroidales bacterium]
MEIFYSRNIEGDILRLDADESVHCVRVLRHREGDEILVMDGEGTLYRCRITDSSPKGAAAVILGCEKNWGSHPYRLTLAVSPTKNNERYEWFAEKATEIGVDAIVPVIGDHSERKVYKTDRMRKILLSAAKQSLKGAVPQACEPVSVKEFIASAPDTALKLVAYCDEQMGRRTSVKEALEQSDATEIVFLIGPEGDFSKEEVDMAIDRGFVPVHLGTSRLRTETAAVTAAEAVYFKFM